MFKCRSPLKITGLSIDGNKHLKHLYLRQWVTKLFPELSRRKLEYHNWQNAMRQKSAVEKTTSDYERYEKNRRRRLLKEKSRKASPSAPPPESRTSVPGATTSSHEKILKCRECHQEIHPPYQIYVCQNNHLHTERVGGDQPNIKVSSPNLNNNFNNDQCNFSIARPVLDPQCAKWDFPRW